MTNDQQVSHYLAALRDSLGPLTLAEREEILREIGAHIRDSAEESGLSVETVLARLGPPERLAAEYRDGFLIRQASRSFSPVVLLRATLRLATKGFFGALVCCCCCCGYFLGAALILTAFLKPFLPTHIGLFAGPTSYGLGVFFPGTEGGQRELLGWWYIPVALVAGSLLLLVTSWAIRFFLRTSLAWQLRLGGGIRTGRRELAAVVLPVIVALSLAPVEFAHRSTPCERTSPAASPTPRSRTAAVPHQSAAESC